MAYQKETRNYANPSGIRLLYSLEATGQQIFSIADATDVGRDLGLSRRSVDTVLQYLTDAGWITRIKKGLYAANDPVTRRPKPHPYAIGTAIASPSAVSHWSALQHWGLTEQIPGVITLSSPSRTYPPRDQTRRIGKRPVWIVAGVPYEFITIPKTHLFGVTNVWVTDKDRVPVFDGERALLDTFHHFQVFGSISVAFGMVEEHLGELDIDRLIQYALDLGITTVIKRVGWTLHEFGVPERQLAPLQSYPAKEESPLDPGLPARGPHNATWRIIENLHPHG